MTTLVGRLRALPSVQVTLAGALLVLGFLIAAQIAAEGPRVRYSTEERAPLIETALGLQAPAGRALKAQILGLRERIGALEAQGPGRRGVAAPPVRRSRAAPAGGRADRRVRAGPRIPARGRQRRAAALDALVTARDVRVLVEELWLAGAEGIAVNGERVSGRARVLDIGGSILVNSAYLAPPYTITAIGPAGPVRPAAALGGLRRVRAGTHRARPGCGCRSRSSTRWTCRRSPAP